MFLNHLKLKDLDSAGCVTGAVRLDEIGKQLIKKRRIQGEADEGAEFIWPEIPTPDQVSREFMTASKVYMTCSKHEKTSAVVEKLRRCIGLPLHLYSSKEINLKEIFSMPSLDDVESVYERSDRDSQETPHRRKTAQVDAFVSEGVKSIQSLEDVDEGPGPSNCWEETISAYPLSMVLIRDKMAAGVFTKNYTATTYPYFFAEALTKMEILWNIGIQHFSPEDLVWLTGGTDKIKSMPVSVFSFTLLGSCVKVCDPELFSGPFISYVKEDDDYDTVVKRLGVTTGEAEADWNAYRLAVVSNKTPFFVPRAQTPALVPSSSSATPTSALMTAAAAVTDFTGDSVGGEDGGGRGEKKNTDTLKHNGNGNSNGNNDRDHKVNKKLCTVWEKILEKNNYEDAINYIKNDLLMYVRDNQPRFENRFPLLGIQRSVTAAGNAAGGLRYYNILYMFTCINIYII